MQTNEICYTFDSKNKISSEIKLHADHMNGGFMPKPANALYDAPSVIELGANETLIIIDEKWTKTPCYIGTKLYHKEDKQEIEISEVGKALSDYPDYTDKIIPDTMLMVYYEYSEDKQDWEFDLEKYKSDKIERVSNMCVEENYKILPQHKRDNIYAGSPASDDYPEYLQGDNGKLSIAKLNAIFQDISRNAKFAIQAATSRENIDDILANIKFPSEDEILKVTAVKD